MKICVIGIGKLGYSIAQTMLGSGNEVAVLDTDSKRIEYAGSNLDAYTVKGDGLKLDTLKEIGLSSYDLCIATTENDEKNLLICSLAKKAGCAKTMARVREPQHINQLDILKEITGVDQLFSPDHACAEEIYKYLTEQYSLEGGLFEQDGIAILEFEIEKMPGLIGKLVKEAKSEIGSLLIGAISRNGKIIIPNGSTKLEKGDFIYLTGLTVDIKTIESKLKSKKKAELPARVMIAGGGKTGFFLAKMLEEKNIAVKIIEQNEDRCKELAESLNDTVVLLGNASDINVLREEGLESMDAFVSATGFDEENMLLSLLVQKYGVKDVLAKVSRTTFIPVFENMGNTAIINPQQIISNRILSYTRRNGVVLFSKSINGQAEFKEIQAESSMPLTNKNLTALTIPDGVLILAVHRGKNIIIPKGDTQIQPGDRVLVLSLLSSVGAFESLLTKTQSSIL